MMFNFFRAANDDPQRNVNDERYWVEGGSRARSEIDIDVTVKRARQIPVVRDCLKVRSDGVAGLEFGVFQRGVDGRVERMEDHPISAVFENPNKRDTSFDFVSHICDDLDSHGDFYGEIIERGGRLVGIERLDPNTVTMDETADGTKRFTHVNRFGVQRVLLEEEVWHIPMLPLVDNLKGTSPILDDGREAVAVAIALQRYANILFTNDATPPYAVTLDGKFKSKADRMNYLSAIRSWLSGNGFRGRHRMGVLEGGAKPYRLGLTAEEAQFLETRQALWLDLCRLWRVPPHLVGIMDNATFSNIEHQSLEFVTHTLRPLIEMIERSVKKFLIDRYGAQKGVYFEFNVSSLLRGDMKSRFEAYAMGRQWGWLSVNDILKMEKQNGIGPQGDRYIEPMNMTPVGSPRQDQQQQKSVETSLQVLHQTVQPTTGLFRPKKLALEVVSDRNWREAA